ncbi:MAG: 6-phosphofructokinase [Elusimicrobia bacterium]|nr:6-phosphofructokinase [Elusimicrobiota bacterium]
MRGIQSAKREYLLFAFLPQLITIGVSAGAEYILVPEIKINYPHLLSDLRKDRSRGKTSVIIVFAEGVGNPYDLADRINKEIGAEVRVSTLGYIQRGGVPTSRSRMLACQFGAYAVSLLLKGKKNRLVVFSKGAVSDIPVSTAIKNKKLFDKELHNLAKQLAT